MNDPVETSELVAFARTVDARSLSRAAAELGVPRATVSRRLARLEARLGVRLLRRTTRSLALTDAGDAFYRHAREVLEAVARAEQSVRRADGAVRGPLRVSLPPGDNGGFQAVVCEFAERYPEVQLRVQFTSQHVDLQREGYDVALRASLELEPGLVARTLGRTPMVAVASPAYLAAHGTPRTARELRGHRCLMGFARGELPATHWPLVRGGRVQLEPALSSNELNLLRGAALRGLGIALVPVLMVGPQLARGELVQVLAGVVGGESRISVVFLEREFVPPQVRAFVDLVVARAPELLGKALAEATPQAGAPRAAKKRARTARRG